MHCEGIKLIKLKGFACERNWKAGERIWKAVVKFVSRLALLEHAGLIGRLYHMSQMTLKLLDAILAAHPQANQCESLVLVLASRFLNFAAPRAEAAVSETAL